MKKTTKIIIWTILLIILIIISFIIYKYEVWESENPKICCNNTCFNIEIAADKETRQLWLMHREFLPDNNWMLFVFEESWIHSFRMKNTLIPLAWIRLDSELNIVDIIQMDPCKTEECEIYTPKFDAKYVIEINQWIISEKWLLKIWDKCKLNKLF